jgi:hypothetical protein
MSSCFSFNRAMRFFLSSATPILLSRYAPAMKLFVKSFFVLIKQNHIHSICKKIKKVSHTEISIVQQLKKLISRGTINKHSSKQTNVCNVARILFVYVLVLLCLVAFQWEKIPYFPVKMRSWIPTGTSGWTGNQVCVDFGEER